MLNKVVIILRACSGAGKSTFADYIKGIKDNNSDKSVSVICTADDYFMQNGKYNFDASNLKFAHALCKKTFTDACEKETELIVVANTNTSEKEFEFYENTASDYGYSIFSLVLENRHNKKNLHDVPETIIEKQKNNIKNSLKLV